MERRTRHGRLTGKKRAGGKKASGEAARWRLDPSIARRIREEAEGLQLSEAEYLNLMAHFSEAVRTASLPSGLLEGGILKMMLGNPLMLEMIKGMLRNMVTQMSDEYDQSSRSPQGMGGYRQGYGGFGGGPSAWQQHRPHYPMWPQQRPERMDQSESADSSIGSLEGLTDLFSKLFSDHK